MAGNNTPFYAKNGIVSNGNFTANSTQVTLGSNVVIDTGSVTFGNGSVSSVLNSTAIAVGANASLTNSRLNIGNSSVNTTANSTQINIGSTLVINTSAVGVGSNIVLNTTNLNIGNSTANTTVNSISINLGTTSVNSTAISVGANVNISTSTVSIGNSTVNNVSNSISAVIGSTIVNSSALALGSNVLLDNTKLLIGNSTINSIINSTSITLGINTLNSTAISVGANMIIDSTKISIGNSTVNTTINATSIGLANGVNFGNTIVNSTIIQVGPNNVINSTAHLIGNSTVNTLITSTTINIGNSTVNSVVNSTAISTLSLLANNTLGSNGQVLLTNSAGIYWGVNNINPNLVYNPFMEIAQQYEGANVTISYNGAAYVLDGWAVGQHSNGASIKAQRIADGPLTYQNSVKVYTVTGNTVAAGDYLVIIHPIEGFTFQDAQFGTANAQSLALTFYAKSSIGSYTACGSLRNSAKDRSYPFNFTIASANTWEKKTILIPGDTSGTWLANNLVGCYLTISPGVGSTFQGTANTWQAGQYLGTSSCTNTLLSTNNATFQVSGVKLEVSPISTPLGKRNFQEELLKCLRYYEKSYEQGTAVGNNNRAGLVGPGIYLGGSFISYLSVPFKANKRAAPSFTFWDGAGNQNAYSVGLTSNWNPENDGAVMNVPPFLGSTTGFFIGINNTQNTTSYVHYSADAQMSL